MQRPVTWRMLRKLGDGILGYDKAIRMADKIAPMRGHEVFAYMSDLLKLKLSVSGLDYVPKTGATIVTPIILQESLMGSLSTTHLKRYEMT